MRFGTSTAFLASLLPLTTALALVTAPLPAAAIGLPGPPSPNGVPLPPGGGPPAPGGPGGLFPRGPFWTPIHVPPGPGGPGGLIFSTPANPANTGMGATQIFTRPPIPLGPPTPPPAAPAAGISGLGLAGIIVGVAVVGTVVITGVNDWVETGNPAQTWIDISSGFSAASELQRISPGSWGVWDNFADSFAGSGRPTMQLVSPGQPAFNYNPGRGNAWGPGFWCLCPSGNTWGNCGVTYTIPRCADEDPYAGDCADFVPGFVKNDPPYCSADSSSDTYRCLRQWCRRGFNMPTAEPRYTCVNMQHCE